MTGRVFLLMTMGRFISLLPESRFFAQEVWLYNRVGGLDIEPTDGVSSLRLHTYPIRIGAQKTHRAAVFIHRR